MILELYRKWGILTRFAELATALFMLCNAFVLHQSNGPASVVLCILLLFNFIMERKAKQS